MENCPRQTGSRCVVPNAENIVHANGKMVIKVNATSEIGSTASDPLEPDIYFKGNNIYYKVTFSFTVTSYGEAVDKIVQEKSYLFSLVQMH